MLGLSHCFGCVVGKQTMEGVCGRRRCSLLIISLNSLQGHTMTKEFPTRLQLPSPTLRIKPLAHRPLVKY